MIENQPESASDHQLQLTALLLPFLMTGDISQSTHRVATRQKRFQSTVSVIAPAECLSAI